MEASLIEDLARRFAYHASIYRGSSPENASPHYAELSRQVAEAPAILQLLAEADRATQVSNLLFGAVHFLLLQGVSHPLAAFYPSLTPAPLPADGAFPAFADFCLQHGARIRELVTRRRIQTNEVQRCTALAPAFGVLAQRLGGRPLSVIEIGASIGLLLLWDRYSYTYGPAGRIGNDPTIELPCVVTSQTGPLPLAQPAIQRRIGIDINPIDPRDGDAILWVRALIWPEHHDRAARLSRAVELLRQSPPPVLEGNAAHLIRGVILQADPGSAVCVFHSYTLNQCPLAIREQILDEIAAAAAVRDVYRISLEWWGDQPRPQLALFTHTGRGVSEELLGYPESHGRTLEWAYDPAE